MPLGIRNLVKSWFSFLNTFSPSSSDMDDLLAKLKAVLDQLTKRVDIYQEFPNKDRISYWQTKVEELKAAPGTVDTKHRIPMKDGKVDQGVWEQKDKKDRRNLWELIDNAFNELCSFNKDRIIRGWIWFGVFLVILVAIVFIYQDLHTGWLGSCGLGQKLSPKLSINFNPKEMTAIWEQVRTVELKLGDVKAKKDKGRLSEVKSDLDKLKALLEKLESKTSPLSVETSRLLGAFSAEIDGDNSTAYPTYQEFLNKLRDDLKSFSPNETIKIWEQVRKVELKLGEVKAKKGKDKLSDLKSDIEKLRGRLDKLKREPILLPFETSRLLGTLSAETEGNDPAAHQTYQEFSKKLRADLESFSTAYFWTASPWRWYELFFSALIGCLVGLLFYIAGLLSQGVFNTEEVSMFLAELFIAPIVVLVVFFLFAFTGITSFAPSEVSLTVNIGFAFILGFAVRRTIGLLDTLKKRIFPDPSPGSSSAGG